MSSPDGRAVIDTLVGCFPRKSTTATKQIYNTAVAAVLSNALYFLLRDLKEWPTALVRAYLVDTLGERVWVEATECQVLVDNIRTAFSTSSTNPPAKRTPPPEAVSPTGSEADWEEVTEEDTGGGANEITRTSAASTLIQDGNAVQDGNAEGWEEEVISEEVKDADGVNAPTVQPRYTAAAKARVEKVVCEMVQMHVQQGRTWRQQKGLSPPQVKHMLHLVETLRETASFAGVRAIISHELVHWAQIGVEDLAAPLGKLIEVLPQHAGGNTKEDREIVKVFARIRVSTKLPAFQSTVIDVAEKMLAANPMYPILALQYLVQTEVKATDAATARELSQNEIRSRFLWASIRCGGSRISKIFGCMIQDFLALSADPRTGLRSLVIKAASHKDFDLLSFVDGLLPIRKEFPKFSNMVPNLRERFVHVITELLALAVLCNTGSAAPENLTALDQWLERPSGAPPETAVKLKRRVADLQVMGLKWLLELSPTRSGFIRLRPDRQLRAVRQVLFMLGSEVLLGAKEEALTQLDALKFRFCHRHCFASEAILSILADMSIGVEIQRPESPHPQYIEGSLYSKDALHVVREVLHRGAVLQRCGVHAIVVNDSQIFDRFLSICAYRPSPMPLGLKPPALVVTQLYYLCWINLAIIAAYNSNGVGRVGWDRYPTLRVLMSMSITLMIPKIGGEKHDPLMVTEEEEDSARRDEQAVFLAFENKYAKAVGKAIDTEATSSKMQNKYTCKQAPRGRCRVLPKGLPEEVIRLSKAWHLGQVLCASQNGGFLQQIMKDAGSVGSMQWLVPQVESNPVIMHNLPSPVLSTIFVEACCKEPRPHFTAECINILRAKISENNSEAQSAVKYFLQQLDLSPETRRMRLYNLLRELFTWSSQGETLWFTDSMPQLPCFAAIQKEFINTLEKLLLTSTSNVLVCVCGHCLLQRLSCDDDIDNGEKINTRAARILGRVAVGRKVARSFVFNADNGKRVLAGIRKIACSRVNIIDASKASVRLNIPGGKSWSTSVDVLVAVIFSMVQGSSHLEDVRWWGEVLESSNNAGPLQDFFCREVRDNMRLAIFRSPLTSLWSLSARTAGVKAIFRAVTAAGISNECILTLLLYLQSNVRNASDFPPPPSLYKLYRVIERVADSSDNIPSALIDLRSRVLSMMPMNSPVAAGHSNVIANLGWTSVSSTEDADTTMQDMQSDNNMTDYCELAKSAVNLSERSGASLALLLMASNNGDAVDVAQAVHQAMQNVESVQFKLSISAYAAEWCSLLQVLCKSSSSVQITSICQQITKVWQTEDRIIPVSETVQWLCRRREAGFEGGTISISALLQAAEAPLCSGADLLADLRQGFANSRLHAIDNATVQDIIQLLQRIHQMSDYDFEGICAQLLSSTFKYNDDKLRACVTQFCMEHLSQRCTDGGHSAELGIWFDLLLLVNPQLKHYGGAMQSPWRLPFQQRQVSRKARGLLASLLELSSTPCIEAHISAVLNGGGESQVSEMCSTTILDFVLAVVRHPRRWLGAREMNKGQSDCVLSGPRSIQVVSHMVMSMARRVASQASSQDGLIAAVGILQDRVALLLHSIRRDEDLRTVVSALDRVEIYGNARSVPFVSECCRCVLAQLRLLKPYIVTRHRGSASSLKAFTAMSSVLDPLFQRALSLMIPSVVSPESVDMGIRAHLLLRKLTLTHPTRLLKFLPSVSAMIVGSLDTDVQGLLLRRVDQLCDWVVGLINALRPIAFHGEAAGAVGGCTRALAQFAEVASREYDDRLDRTMGKILTLMADYIQANCSSARSQLLPHIESLRFHALHCEQNLPMFRGNEVISAFAMLTESPVSIVSNSTTEVSSQLSILGEQLSVLQNLGTVADMDGLRELLISAIESLRGEVDRFLTTLLQLMKSRHTDARELAYPPLCLLAARSPEIGRQLQLALCQCFQSPYPEVVNTAVQHSPAVFAVTPGGGSQVILALLGTESSHSKKTRSSVKEILGIVQQT